MHDISLIIQTLTSEEKSNFESYLKKKNTRGDTKNIQLFRLLDTDQKIPNADVLLYGKKATGAYHALCKRVLDSLIDFIATKNLEKESSAPFEALKLLMVSRYFFEHKMFKIAFKTLYKAERKALEHEVYSILNEVYYTHIQYAHLNPKSNLEALIQIFKANQKALRQEEQLNLFYAQLQQQLRVNSDDINLIIHSVLHKFDLVIQQDLSYRSLFKILEIISNTAHLSQNYQQVLPFIEANYKHISSKGILKDHQLFYHIHILYYVSNAYFRNRSYDLALSYLETMQAHMQLQQQKYYSYFLPQYCLLKALILHYTNHAEEALSLLTSFSIKEHKNQYAYLLDIQLILIVCHSQNGSIRKAYTLMKELYHSDTWYLKKTDIGWVLNKHLVEILLLIELDEIDLVASRIKSFQLRYVPYLKKQQKHALLHFIKLVTQYYQFPEERHLITFKKKFHKIFDSLDLSSEDIFTISFYGWLYSKIHLKELYTTILELTSFNKK